MAKKYEVDSILFLNTFLMKQEQYTPDSALCDFFLFLKLKVRLNSIPKDRLPSSLNKTPRDIYHWNSS